MATLRCGLPAGRQAGFTLIEMMVVIALIGILAAMLFPVFARAREMARRAQCAANVSELGLALQMYAADYGGRYPPQEDNLAPVADRVATDTVFKCPSARFMGPTLKQSARIAKAKQVRYLHYGVSAVAAQQFESYSPVQVIADGVLYGSSYYYHAGLTADSPSDRVLVTEREAAHMDHANVLYASGRLGRVPEVEWRKLLPASARFSEKDFPPEGSYGMQVYPPPSAGRGGTRGGRGGRGGRG